MSKYIVGNYFFILNIFELYASGNYSIRAIQAKMKKASVTPQVKFSTLQKIPLFSEFDYKEMSKLLTFMKMKRNQKEVKLIIFL